MDRENSRGENVAEPLKTQEISYYNTFSEFPIDPKTKAEHLDNWKKAQMRRKGKKK